MDTIDENDMVEDLEEAAMEVVAPPFLRSVCFLCCECFIYFIHEELHSGMGNDRQATFSF